MSPEIAWWTDDTIAIDAAGKLRSIPVRRCAWIIAIEDGICHIAMSRELDPHCPPEDDGHIHALAFGVWSLSL